MANLFIYSSRGERIRTFDHTSLPRGEHVQQFVVVAIHHDGTIIGQRTVCIGGEFFARCAINIGNLLITCNNVLTIIKLKRVEDEYYTFHP